MGANNELNCKSNRIGTDAWFRVTVVAQAQFTWKSYTDDAVPGHVVNDLYVDYAGSTPIVEMLLDAPGLIFQDPTGAPAGGPPNVL